MKKAVQLILGLLFVFMLAFTPLFPSNNAFAQELPPLPDHVVSIPQEKLAGGESRPVADLMADLNGPVPHALEAFSDPMVSVIVQFEGPALAERVAERGRMTPFDQRSYTATLRSRQGDVINRVQQAGGAVIGQFTKAYNGVQVQVQASELAALRSFSGVKAVYPVRTHFPALSYSTDLIGANAVWGLEGGGYTGEGVTIAVIDTGIDYTHAAFGGPGTAQAIAENDPDWIETGSFPTVKVIGGYDFAGTDYDASSPDPLKRIPLEDPDPLDESGHGTHVASIAAGFGVDAALTQGVAPDAVLYALKVFGASGGTKLIVPALEWCMDPNNDGDTSDRVDVVNFSLGSDFGPADGNDPEIIALENLSALGTVVVAASGNSGNTEYITGSPASADSAISVAATTSNRLGAANFMASFSSRGPRGYDSALKPEISAPGTDIFAAGRGTGDQGDLMSGTSMATPHVAGVAALVRQAHPEWTAEEVKAALMNTALDVGHEISRMGAGRVDALRAVTTTTVAVGDPKLVSLSWGVIEFNTAVYADSKPVTVRNIDPDESKTYDLSWDWGASSSGDGAALTVPASVTVAAGGQASFQVALELDAEEIEESVSQWSFLEEYSGFIWLENREDSSDVLALPFYFVPAPYSTIAATELVTGESTATGSFDHAGPIASDLEIWPVYVTDANDAAVNDNADIRIVMMNGYSSGDGDVIAFGFNLYGPLHNPQPGITEIDLYLDVDQDGTDDYVIFNYNLGWSEGLDHDNRWIPVTFDLKTKTYQWGDTVYYIWTDYNSGTMFWYLPAGDYQLGPGDSKLDFSIVAHDYEGDRDSISARPVDYREVPFYGEPGNYEPLGDQDVSIDLWINSPAGYEYNQPLGAGLFDYSGKAGAGQVTFLPFQWGVQDTSGRVFLPMVIR